MLLVPGYGLERKARDAANRTSAGGIKDRYDQSVMHLNGRALSNGLGG